MRRMLVYVINGFVLLCLLIGFVFVSADLFGEWVLPGCLLIVWGYVVLLKPTRLRTVGYRVAGCRIVNLQGERPSVFRMTFRSLLWIMGPFNLLIDLFWCASDDDRQTLRDRFAGTCVIRNDARPVGTGEVHLTRFNALGYALAYPAVVHRRELQPTAADETR
jgi:uncharacterized RDD family membrane protein YckC